MTFGELIGALGERLGMELPDEGGASAVDIDGNEIVIQLADDDLVLLHSDLGELPVSAQNDIVSAAIEANYLYQGTGGSTLAVNPRTGHLHIQKYNWLERLDPEKAVDTLTRFAETASAWRRMAGECASREQFNVAMPFGNLV